jgi:hypothetical protein
VTHQSDILEVKRLDDRSQIIRIPIHVVPGGGLAGSAMATTIMCDDSKAILS